MQDEVTEYIEDEVNEYKYETYELLDVTKILFFSYLINRKTKAEFKERITKEFEKYDKNTVNRLNKAFKDIDGIIAPLNEKETEITLIKPNESILKDMFKKMDTKSSKKAQEKFFRELGVYYDRTSKTLKKEWVNEQAYLSKKVNDYVRIEKVVPYYDKNTGEVVRYNDIATYNSMVYNTNLTKSAWNSTFNSALRNGNDLVYMPSHPFACPLCQEHQGKIYSLTGNAKGYPLLSDVADEYGSIHPNCKHSILQYWGQLETDEYSSLEWIDRYEAKQKKQGLELQRSRLKADKEIYQRLGNEEQVDKINQKIRALNSEIKEQKSLMQ